MAYQKKIKPVFSKEVYIEAIKSCETKGEFTTKFPKLYRQLLQLDYGKDLINSLPRKMKWVDVKLINEARKYKSKVEWMRENISSYNTALRDKELFLKCTLHMKNENTFGKTKYDYEYCKNAYAKYDNLKEIIANEKPSYNAAIRNGWHDELSKDKKKYSSHKSNKWTFEKVRKEALKYNSIKEFANNSRPAYFKAVYSKWLLEIIGHMKGGYTKWTVEKVAEVLKNYEQKNWYKIKECKAPLAYIKRHKLENELEIKLKTIK
jgi:hypothetical protein